VLKGGRMMRGYIARGDVDTKESEHWSKEECSG
jgi:hypothetical protein